MPACLAPYAAPVAAVAPELAIGVLAFAVIAVAATPDQGVARSPGITAAADATAVSTGTAVDADAQAMSKASRLLGHIFVGASVILNPGGKEGGNVDTGDQTATGTGQVVTEPEPKGKLERKEEEGGIPAAGE